MSERAAHRRRPRHPDGGEGAGNARPRLPCRADADPPRRRPRALPAGARARPGGGLSRLDLRPRGRDGRGPAAREGRAVGRRDPRHILRRQERARPPQGDQAASGRSSRSSFLSMHSGAAVRRARPQGGRGRLRHEEGRLRELLSAVRRVAAGGRWVTQEVAESLADAISLPADRFRTSSSPTGSSTSSGSWLGARRSRRSRGSSESASRPSARIVRGSSRKCASKRTPTSRSTRSTTG